MSKQKNSTGRHDYVPNAPRRCRWLKRRKSVVVKAFAQVGHTKRHDSTIDTTRTDRFVKVVSPVSVGGLKSVLDLLQKGEGYPSSAVFVSHAQKSEAVVHSVMKHVPNPQHTGGSFEKLSGRADIQNRQQDNLNNGNNRDEISIPPMVYSTLCCAQFLNSLIVDVGHFAVFRGDLAQQNSSDRREISRGEGELRQHRLTPRYQRVKLQTWRNSTGRTVELKGLPVDSPRISLKTHPRLRHERSGTFRPPSSKSDHPTTAVWKLKLQQSSSVQNEKPPHISTLPTMPRQPVYMH